MPLIIIFCIFVLLSTELVGSVLLLVPFDVIRLIDAAVTGSCAGAV
jgi:hypothetical protein